MSREIRPPHQRTSKSDELDARISAVAEAAATWRDPDHPARARAVEESLAAENSFTEEAVAFAINQQMSQMTEEALAAWISERVAERPHTIGVLNAGNVPMVGLQDFLAVILTGHHYLGTISSKSPALLPAFARELTARYSDFRTDFVEADELFDRADALIATGSDETAAWVREQAEEHGIPAERRLVRGHSFAVAVLAGTESEDELEGLAEDALLHEGFGCRNVAIIWAPAGYPPDDFLETLARFRGVFPAHDRTPRRLKMQQAFLEAVNTSHAYGEGLEFLVSKGDPEPQAPGHLRWTDYGHLSEVFDWMEDAADRIQLVVAGDIAKRGVEELAGARADEAEQYRLPIEPLGNAQRPRVTWCPDGIDTVEFLTTLR